MNANSDNAVGAGSKMQKDWACPYPHHTKNGSKPSPDKAESFAAECHTLDAICGDAGCSQPVQFCPACGESNRALAKFCRSCRQALAFEDAVIQFQAAHEIDAKSVIKEFRQVELPQMHGRSLSAMASGWGYLLVAAPGWGLGVLANTRLHPPRLLSRFGTGSDTITSLHALRQADMPPGFLAIGTQQISRLNMLPDFQYKTLFHLPDPAWTISGSLLAGAALIVRVWHRQSGWSRWLLMDCRTEQIQALPFQQRSEMSEVIAAPEPDKLLYHTRHEIILLDARAGIEHRQPGPPCGLDINVRPRLLARTGDVFLSGLDGMLYRCNLAEGQATPAVFGRGRHELVHLFLSAYDDYLYLLCRDNLVLIDYPSGAAIWNAQQHAKTLIHCGRLQPQQWGNYLIFSVCNSVSSGPAERLALFSLGQRGAPLLLHPEAAQMPAPVAGVTNMIAARVRHNKTPGEPATLLLFQL